jgi:hypothetical protein
LGSTILQTAYPRRLAIVSLLQFYGGAIFIAPSLFRAENGLARG